jgi:hypothetical protein
MKLLEFRFESLSESDCRKVSGEVIDWFVLHGDVSLEVVRVSDDRVRLEHLPASLTEAVDMLGKSLFLSQRLERVEPGKIVSIRSVRTCRLAVTELDALLRLRVAHEDAIPEFFMGHASATDISHWLIETDLFDFT